MGLNIDPNAILLYWPSRLDPSQKGIHLLTEIAQWFVIANPDVQIGNLFGATATNRDTGGYHDKIEELALRTDGAPEDRGNGFLFRDYVAGGLWYGLARSVAFHRRKPEIREAQLRRIMREARETHSLERMIDSYMAIYERLNNNVPLM